ncbi:MAG: NADH-quinone oxidoreductase subunit H [Armatimonadetes bacterium]|nr:NADH-quinone oxidoreductase subunit H [Armatimonadota bacterium]
MQEWLEGLHPAILALIKVLLFVVPLLMLVPGLIWWERRLLSWMQDRIGPNRTGTITLKSGKKIKLFGLLQPIADGIKLFFKEDVTPNSIDRLIYFLAPAIALFPAFALGGTVPLGPSYGIYGLLTPIANVDIGVLYFLAISSLGVYGVVLGGYASNNKYSLMGGLRGSAQLISYELAMGVSLACIVMASGSLRLTDILKTQEQALWGAVPWLQNWFIFTPFGLLSAVIFGICMVAETNRVPFDLPEAENEIIAGYHTEYSSMKFAVYFMGEYAAMFVFSGIFATVFVGGYNLLPINWEYLMDSQWVGQFATLMHNLQYWLAPLVFLFKCAVGITFYIWFRATLPRLRYDQLMSLGWKNLLPTAVLNFIVVAIWILVTKIHSTLMGIVAGALAYVLLYFLFKSFLGATRDKPILQKRTLDYMPEPPKPQSNPVTGA